MPAWRVSGTKKGALPTSTVRRANKHVVYVRNVHNPDALATELQKALGVGSGGGDEPRTVCLQGDAKVEKRVIAYLRSKPERLTGVAKAGGGSKGGAVPAQAVAAAPPAAREAAAAPLCGEPRYDNPRCLWNWVYTLQHRSCTAYACYEAADDSEADGDTPWCHDDDAAEPRGAADAGAAPATEDLDGALESLCMLAAPWLGDKEERGSMRKERVAVRQTARRAEAEARSLVPRPPPPPAAKAPSRGKLRPNAVLGDEGEYYGDGYDDYGDYDDYLDDQGSDHGHDAPPPPRRLELSASVSQDRDRDREARDDANANANANLEVALALSRSEDQQDAELRRAMALSAARDADDAELRRAMALSAAHDADLRRAMALSAAGDAAGGGDDDDLLRAMALSTAHADGSPPDTDAAARAVLGTVDEATVDYVCSILAQEPSREESLDVVESLLAGHVDDSEGLADRLFRIFEAPAPAAPSPPWSCAACTFENVAGASACGMCETPR